MKNLYEIFGTEEDFEVNGVWNEFGDTRIKIARNGNRNTEYWKTFEKVTKRLNKIGAESLPKEEQDRLMAEVYAKSIIKGWEVRNEKGEWEVGMMIMEKGKLKKVPYSIENVVKCLLDLPDLFTMIQKYANDIKTFQKEAEEKQLGN